MKFWLSILSLLVPCLLIAQQNNFQYYSVADGLAQSQVYSMIEDHNGYLWMGTQGGGLNRFDGQEFETFTVANGLINNSVDAIYEANELIYIGAKNGMSIFDGRAFKNYLVSKEENIAVTAFHKYKGLLLVGTNKGVFEFDGDQFTYSQQYNGTKASRIFCFYQDAQNRLWIGTRNGVSLFEAENKKELGLKEGFTAGEVTGICEDQKGNIWFSTYTGAYFYNARSNDKVGKGRSFTRLDNKDGIASDYLNDVFCDKSGNIWLASQDNGVSIWHPKDSLVTQLNAETGLCNNNVRQILEDSWGSIWMATSGGGVCKYAGQQFLHINISERPADNLVYSLCQDSSGAMWFAAADDGVVRLDSAGITRFGAKEGFVNSKAKAMLRDSRGRLWFGTNDNGVAYFNGESFEFLKYKNRILGRLAKDIIEDERGNIWVASSSEGVYKIIPGDSTIQVQQVNLDTINFNDSLIVQRDTLFKDSIIFTYQAAKIAALNKNINALHFDRLGRLWFATRLEGIGYYTENGTIMYDRSIGLPTNDIRSIVEDEKGNLWIGTAGFGIARLSIYTDTLGIRSFNENDGLSSGNVYLMSFDDNGDLWVGCGRGVDRISLDEEQHFKAMKSYGKADGFLGVETCQNAVMKDRDGNLWFGTIDGVTKYLPGSKNTNLVPPKLQITGVELANEPFQTTQYTDWIDTKNQFKKGLALPYNKNKLSFDFLGINLANPLKVTYQWMLEGSDQDWSKRSAKNSITYSSLPPGEYVFKVRAYNEDLIPNDPPMEMSFTILSPIWQRWWFITTGVLLLSGIIGVLVNARIASIRRKAKAQQDRLEMENNLLQLEQKALQLQMNPHFIFNALNTVQSLFMSNEQEAARQLLSKFAKLMRAILENSRAQRIPLQKEVDLLDNYLAIEQFSRSGKFEYEIKVDPALDPDEVNIPPMMIQPFVENAVIHGVNHLKSGGLIQLRFQKDKDQLLCTVRDNGIGRVAAAKLKEQNTRKHTSIALDVTKERLGFLNHDKDSKNLVINDLNNINQSDTGTEVLIRLPLEEW